MHVDHKAKIAHYVFALLVNVQRILLFVILRYFKIYFILRSKTSSFEDERFKKIKGFDYTDRLSIFCDLNTHVKSLLTFLKHFFCFKA